MLLVAVSIPVVSEGQAYFTAAGLRMGSDFGVTVQQRIITRFTLQGIVSSSAVTNQTTGTLLAQMHKPLISKRFNFYLGGGVHNRWQQTAEGTDFQYRGFTAIAGAEMTLGRFNLSWDFKPVYHLNSSEKAFETETAISLRYVFIKKIKTKRNNGIFKTNDPEKIKARKDRKKARRKKKRIKAREKKKASRSKN